MPKKLKSPPSKRVVKSKLSNENNKSSVVSGIRETIIHEAKHINSSR